MKRKQAILILCSHGQEKLVSLLNDFDDLTNIDIYVHIDTGKTCFYDFNDLDNLVKIGKIKKYISKIKGKYCDISLVEATLELIRTAIGSEEQYSHIHLFSERCRMICDCNYFVDFFNNNLDKSFIEYKSNKLKYSRKRLCKDLDAIDYEYHRYYGSQWWSLKYEDVLYILRKINQNEDLFNKYKKSGNVKTLGAMDETFFQCFLVGEKLKEGLSIDNIINNSLRYINWSIPRNKGMHPNDLMIDYLPAYELSFENKKINEQILICRKININNDKSVEFLSKIKEIFYNEVIRC